MGRRRAPRHERNEPSERKQTMAMKQTIIRAGLETLYFSGAYQMMRPFVAGIGAILTLHHVRPPRPEQFQPNRLLEITPEFLEEVLIELRRSELDLVSLDEMHRRLVERDFRRRFVCITIDDGYRDTLQWAYPILRRHQAPFTVYIPTSFPDRVGELWWLVLEAVVARNEVVNVRLGGQELVGQELGRQDETLRCTSVAEKRAAFD